ncbi:hypothetical protein [Sphingomonas ginkgonis]|uniref:hypothetical protein n=1 Tax=Sphingomonas ginkgonis TaxID=2315330 RepID=UPI00163A8440|nr:hypothetical protein [Sphingomonas ginkgonis]
MLLREVERYLDNSKVPATKFGRMVMKDPRFVFDLRRGREPRAQTMAKVRQYLERVK